MFPLCSEKSDWREGPKREPNLVGDRYTTVMSVTRPLHLGDGRSVPWRRRPGDNWIGVGRKFSLHPLGVMVGGRPHYDCISHAASDKRLKISRRFLQGSKDGFESRCGVQRPRGAV